MGATHGAVVWCLILALWPQYPLVVAIAKELLLRGGRGVEVQTNKLLPLDVLSKLLADHTSFAKKRAK